MEFVRIAVPPEPRILQSSHIGSSSMTVGAADITLRNLNHQLPQAAGNN
ncbi:hypothetical protein MA5S0304_1984 [Mycobacteroides abscessus 5S-0304]|nr:hypothetical protein MA5S0304_1984 [Mycobacteroides abscessus 5S-0304]EIU42925.1 hypothetical protein MA5S1215_5033 [Mycobacteroides abscessus 5S-1215]